MTAVKIYTLASSGLINSSDHFDFISNILKERMNGIF